MALRGRQSRARASALSRRPERDPTRSAHGRFVRVMLTALASAAIGAAGSAGAGAESAQIRIARQFSMGYLQFNLMERHRLIERHAQSAGLPDLAVTWATFNSPAAMNDALLSGSVDIVSGGVPGLLTIWSRTQGTDNPVKGIAAFSSQPILLNTRNPGVKSIADFTAADKIAVPAVKVSVQAIMLQMAAARTWGQANFAKLDALTVGMSPPDATIALLSGQSGITSVFSVPPFQEQQLEHPAIHTVLNSYDVFGGPHTFTVAWTTARVRDANPILYQAMMAAFAEATAMLTRGVGEASQYWVENAKSKLPVDKVVQIASGKQVRWTMVPEATLKYADFMHAVGSIKVKPASWKEVFFPDLHDMPGS